jgi:hypothetical protein
MISPLARSCWLGAHKARDRGAASVQSSASRTGWYGRTYSPKSLGPGAAQLFVTHAYARSFPLRWGTVCASSAREVRGWDSSAIEALVVSLTERFVGPLGWGWRGSWNTSSAVPWFDAERARHLVMFQAGSKFFVVRRTGGGSGSMVPIGCEPIREASRPAWTARNFPFAGRDLEAHLAACAACQDFETDPRPLYGGGQLHQGGTGSPRECCSFVAHPRQCGSPAVPSWPPPLGSQPP